MAQRCLYGVDKNPMAVDLAKLSLWLATLAKDHPFTFLDHALKCGDSLVGLTKAQILGFHWKPEKQRDFARAAIEGQLNRALEQRRQIREAPDGTSEALLRERLTAADGFLDPGRRYGDLVVSAFFAADNDRQRKERLEVAVGRPGRPALPVRRRAPAAARGRRGALSTVGPHPIIPFHWEIEFPEVFDRENPGFDAFVGNPPFRGRNTHLSGYGGQLPATGSKRFTRNPRQRGSCRPLLPPSVRLLRQEGHFGLIATNTIGQGDTRSDGPALDLHPWRDDLRSDPPKEVAWAGCRCHQRRPRSQGTYRRAMSSRRSDQSRSSQLTSSTPVGTTTQRC